MSLAPLVVNESQIAGIKDDGTPEGIVRVGIKSGRLIPLDLVTNNTYYETGTGSSVGFQYGIFYNASGSQNGISVTPGTTAGASYVKLSFPFFGKTLGIRIAGVSTNSFPSFTVEVDGGDSVQVVSSENTLKVQGRQSGITHEIPIITHRDLQDLPNGQAHRATIIFGPSAVGCTVLGAIVEENGCYHPVARVAHGCSSNVLVPSTFASKAFYAPVSGITSGAPFRYISMIEYSNLTGGSITLYRNSDASTPTQGSVDVIASNTTLRLAFTTPITSNQFTHWASATGLYVMAWGGHY